MIKKRPIRSKSDDNDQKLNNFMTIHDDNDDHKIDEETNAKDNDGK